MLSERPPGSPKPLSLLSSSSFLQSDPQPPSGWSWELRHSVSGGDGRCWIPWTAPFWRLINFDQQKYQYVPWQINPLVAH